MIYLLAPLAFYWGWHAAYIWSKCRNNEEFWRIWMKRRNLPWTVIEVTLWPIMKLIALLNNGNLPRVLLFFATIGRKP